MYTIKKIYEINGERYSESLEMSERRFISRFRVLNGRTPRFVCCDDVYNIVKRETKKYVIFDCELESSNIIERYYFNKEYLRRLNLL